MSIFSTHLFNVNLTLDMLYHPRLLFVYNIFHNISFVSNTLLTPISVYVIIKKSSESMSYYKYVLLNGILWNFLLELMYFLYKPVNLFPYFLFYPIGVMKFMSPDLFPLIFYMLGAGLFGVVHSMGFAILYRVAIVYPMTKYNEWFSEKRSLIVLYLLTLFYFEVMWAAPFSVFIFLPYNSTSIINSITSEAPIYDHFAKSEPSLSGLNFAGACSTFLVFLGITTGLISFTIIPSPLVALIIYAFKFYKLSHQEFLSTQTHQMNKMLFKVLLIQLWVIGNCWAVPSTIIAVVILADVPYANFIAQACLFMPLLYANLEIMTLMYFIKPYREYIRRLVEKVFIRLKLKQVVPEYVSQLMSGTNAQGLSRTSA